MGQLARVPGVLLAIWRVLWTMITMMLPPLMKDRYWGDLGVTRIVRRLIMIFLSL
jgi:hypothetical protein